MERVNAVEQESATANGNADGSDEEVSSNGVQKLSTSKIAAKQAGIEFVAKSRFGPYFLWPEQFQPMIY